MSPRPSEKARGEKDGDWGKGKLSREQRPEGPQAVPVNDKGALRASTAKKRAFPSPTSKCRQVATP